MELVGRDAPCGRLLAILDQAARGDGSAVTLTGEAGAGKSALIGWLASSADAMRVLRVRGAEVEAPLSYAALGDLLAPIMDSETDLPPMQAAALASALRRGAAVEVDRLAVCAATLNVLLAAARAQPLLVLVDDSQWIDEASLEAFVFATRRIDVAPVCMVFAARSGPAYRPPSAGLPRVDLGGLSAAAAAELVRREHGPVDHVVLDWLMRETGGNPLALLELPRLLSAQDLALWSYTSRPAPVLTSVEHVYQVTLGGLDAATRNALLVAAMLDRDTKRILWPAIAAAGHSAEDLLPAADVGLIDLADHSLEFRHPLVRSAIHQISSTTERRNAHLAVAAAIAHTDDPHLAMAYAWHLADACVGWDERVAGLLDASAKASMARGGYRAAALAFVRSAQLTSEPGRRRDRLLRAASAEFATGDLPRCNGVLSQIEAEGGASDPEFVRLRARTDMWTGAPLLGSRRLVAEAQLLQASEPERAITLWFDAAIGFSVSGEVEMAVNLADRLHQLTASMGGPVALLARAGARATHAMRGDVELATQPIDDAMNGLPLSQVPTELLEPLIYIASGYLFLDRLDTAQRSAEALVQESRERGALASVSFALACQSVVEFRSGHWTDAYGSALESLQLARDTGRATDIPNCLDALSLVEAARGLPEARAHAQGAIDLATDAGAELVKGQGHSMLGLLDLGLGQLDAAIPHLQQAGAIFTKQGALQIGHFQWAPELIEALARAGRIKETTSLVSFMVERSQAVGIPIAAGLAARCQGIVSRDDYDEHFESALNWHTQGSPRPFEIARTALCYGERLRRSKRRKDARIHLREALTAFTELGAGPWAERAAAELRASGVPATARTPRPLDVLTAQERQVASVIQTGASNREAAAQLFLSQKTVEFHLSRIFRKLNITSRRQLPSIQA